MGSNFISVHLSMRAVILIMLTFSLAIAGLSAQGQVTFQERAYWLDSKYKFIKTSDIDRQGNVIIGGLIRPTSDDLHNSIVLLIEPNTDTIWTLRGPDVPNFGTYPGVKFRANGGFAFATSSKKSNPIPPTPPPLDNWDGVLQKLSSTGSLLMNKSFNPAIDNNGITSFLTMPDKGYLINGWGGVPGSPSATLSLTRTDSAGTVLWQRNHSTVSAWGLDYMEHAKNGKVILAGTYPGVNPGITPFRLKLLLVNANGDSLRANTLNLTVPSRSEYMFSPGTEHGLVSLSDGGFLITGLVDTVNASAGINSALGLVAKVDANLQLVWKYIFRPGASMANNVSFRRAKELKDGTIILLGQSFQTNSFQIYRLSSNGNLLATYPFTSSLYPSIRLNTLETLPDSSFLIGGQCRTAGNAHTGFYIAKVKIPNLPAGRPSLIQLLGKGEELVTASTALGAAYPNPAAEQVFIPYNLPKGTHNAVLKLTDITGREVGNYTLKQKMQDRQTISVSRLPNGLYLYTLVADGKHIATRKLAVMK